MLAPVHIRFTCITCSVTHSFAALILLAVSVLPFALSAVVRTCRVNSKLLHAFWRVHDCQRLVLLLLLLSLALVDVTSPRACAENALSSRGNRRRLFISESQLPTTKFGLSSALTEHNSARTACSHRCHTIPFSTLPAAFVTTPTAHSRTRTRTALLFLPLLASYSRLVCRAVVQ